MNSARRHAVLLHSSAIASATAFGVAVAYLVAFGIARTGSSLVTRDVPLLDPVIASGILLAAAASWLLRVPNGKRAVVARALAAMALAAAFLRFHSTATAVPLALMAVSFLIFDLRWPRNAWLAEGFAYSTVALSAFGLIGFLYAAPSLHGSTTLGACFAYLFLAASAVLARPDRGFCSLAFGETLGGALVRRMVPAAVLVPFAFAWVRVQAQRAGFFGLEVGTALVTLVIVAFLIRMIVAAARDLSISDLERSRAEAALRKSLERQQILFDSNLIAILRANAKDEIFDANAAFLDLIGYTREELPLHWHTITPPEWYEQTEIAKREIASIGRVTPFEKEYLRKDGTRVPVLIGAMTLPGEADADERVAFVVDLRGKQQAEVEVESMKRFLDSVVENLPNMVFVKDAKDLRFVRFNRAGEELLGLSRENLIGKNDYDFFPKEEADFFVAKDRAVLDSGALLDIPEEPIHTAREETRFLHTKKVPILDSEGVPRYLLGISEDITNRKQTELELSLLNDGLRRRTQELEVANKELESFSYSVSHDLRAPLRHIDGFTDLLSRHVKGTLDETGQRYLETISGSAKQMGRLIDDLLAFSRMNRSHMQDGVVDLDHVVRDTIVGLRPEIGDKDIAWQIGDLPRIRGDAGMLRLVFNNLLSNAVKYSSRQARARIEIASGEAGDEIVFYVRDNGVGFDMRYAHKLFGVFQRLHGDDEFEGTGIGLANVQRIIHRHGGRTWAEGEVDRGATFYVALPRERRFEEEEVAR